MGNDSPFLVISTENNVTTALTVVYPPMDMVKGMHKEVRYTWDISGNIIEQTGIYLTPKSEYAYGEDKGNAVQTRSHVPMEEMLANTKIIQAVHVYQANVSQKGYFPVYTANDISKYFAEIPHPEIKPDVATIDHHPESSTEQDKPKEPVDYVSIYNTLVKKPEYWSLVNHTLINKEKGRSEEIDLVKKIEKDFALASPEVEGDLPAAAHILFTSLLDSVDSTWHPRVLKPMPDEKKERMNQIFAKTLALYPQVERNDGHRMGSDLLFVVINMFESNTTPYKRDSNFWDRLNVNTISGIVKEYKKNHAGELDKPEVKHVLGELDEIAQLSHQVSGDSKTQAPVKKRGMAR